MLGSFWGSRRDTSGGDTTPKAPVHSNPDRERNPFEASLSSSSSSAGRQQHSRKNSATTTGANSNVDNTSNSTTSRDYASSPAPSLLSNLSTATTPSNASTTSLSSISNLSSSTSSSSHSQQHSSSSIHHGHHGLPAGLRTPTLQKSFVLPEVTSSVNATGLHAPNTSSKTATAALHQSPMYPQNSSSGHAAGGAAASNSGRNTPTRTAHTHTQTAPYPNPKEHIHGSSPKSKQPDFKLSQPPDSKNSPSKKNGDAPSTPINQTFSSTSSSATAEPSSSANSSASASTQVATSNISTGAGNAPTSTSTLQSSVRKRENHGSSSLKGKLTVKIIEARNLVTPEANIRPYVVATFEQNEFVSREAINEHEEDARGEPVSPRTSSHLRSSQRGPKANGGGSPTAAGGENGTSGNGDSMDTSTASAYHPVWKHEVAFDVTLDHSPVTICVYARRGDEEFFLGLVDVKPELKHGWQVDDWYKLNPRQDEEVTGDVHVRMRFERSEQRRTLRSSDFEFLRMIGKGTFGRVFQVRKKDTKRIYAMKVLSKREIIAKKEVQHTIGERKILQRSSECPFLLGLKFSFQSETELFLVMDFKSGGELFHHLQKEGRFTEDRARFYAAEITLAFEYLHKYHIVYRDLKPENILLDATGHIVLCDFGLSKPDLPSNALTNTFCGTTEYLAPEVLLDDHGYSQTVDFWSLGVLLFEMCCGWSPFYAEDTQQMYKNICFGKIKFPRGVIGDDGKQFVKGLLNRNPAHRLGAKRDAAELKEHPFFKMIDWEALAARQVTVPFKPYVDSDECVRNFDAEFTDADVQREAPVDTGAYFDDDAASAWIDEPANGADARKQGPMPIHPSKNRLDEEAQDAFRGFSYSGDAELNDLMMSASVRDNNDDDMRS